MLKICIIDDELMAVQYLDFLLNKIEEVEVTGKYMDSDSLIQHVQKQHVDVVFMDIRMPGIKGIDLAEQLLNIEPDLHIVFVTAYDEYAVQAFELNALDYILKPVKKERFELTIQRLRKESNYKLEKKPFQSTYLIKNLGAIQIYRDKERMDVKWRTTKAKELFAYFIQHHENIISKSKLISLLWNNLPWEKANAQLYTAVYQIRKVIQHTEAPIKIISEGESYSIDMDDEIHIQSSEFKIAAQNLLKNDMVDAEAYFMILEAYQGDYLAGMNSPWVLKERIMLKELWLELINKLSEHIHCYEEASSYHISKLREIVSIDEAAASKMKQKCEN